MSGRGTEVRVLRLDDVVVSGRDSPRRPWCASHLELAFEDKEEGVRAEVLDLRLDGPLLLLLAGELDEVQEQPPADPTEGWEPLQAAGSDGRVHRGRAGEGGWGWEFIATRCKRGSMGSRSRHRPPAEW